MRPFMKLLGIIPLLALYLLVSACITLLPAGTRLRRLFRIKNSSFFCRIMLMLLGVHLHVKHREHLQKKNSGLLVVSNHVSYVDALVIASLTPAVFITSVELGSTLFLGILARFGGSLFVERRKASGLKNEISLIVRVLREGFTVTLFPEGTTSNGDRVQPFKNSLFDAAVSARADVLPVCLRYMNVNGKRITAANRDSIFYYGGTSFFHHIPKLLSLTSVEVEVIPLKLIRVQDGDSRKDLAALAHSAISTAYFD
jgi:1-acyl-sn-glycerol-3-phosphate acyltransferase